MTPILDSMAVLAANKGNDKDGVLILADEKWLATSVFNKVRVRHSCRSYDDFVIREGYGDRLVYDYKNIYKIPYRKFPYYEDPDKVFYFSKASTKDKPTSFCSDPLNGCGVTVKTSWLNLYYLIDMATDELAKEINNMPIPKNTVAKKARLNCFHDAIEQRAIPFILDELPSFMVDFLGHQLTDIIDLMKHEIQTIYQLIFLLSDQKAGVGNGCFMWHVNYEHLGRNYFRIPFFDGCDVTGSSGVIFNFPLGDCLSLGDHPDNQVDWLGDDNIVYEESFDDEPDYYLFRKIIELFKGKKILPLRFDCCWQYLSIDNKHRLSVKNIMQEVLTYGLKTISKDSFINSYFVKEVCRKGVASVNWKNIFHPDLSSLSDYYY